MREIWPDYAGPPRLPDRHQTRRVRVRMRSMPLMSHRGRWKTFAAFYQHSLTLVGTRLHLSRSHKNLRKLTETQNGIVRIATVPAAVCVHRILSHHLSVVHDRPCGMADGPRGITPHNRASGVSPCLRILAEDIRCRFRSRCRLRHRDGVPAGHQLERAIADVRANPGAAPRLRDVHRLLPRGQLLRDSSLRPLARAALVIPVQPAWSRWERRSRRSGS